MTEPTGTARDRDSAGRPAQSRPRDALGRPLPRSAQGVPPLPEPLPEDPAIGVPLAQSLLAAGRPFQAHEVFEALWRTCRDDERELWQALAQLAAAITHAARGNRTGASRLLRRSARRLAMAGPGAAPVVDVPALREWIEAALQADAAGRPWWSAPPTVVGIGRDSAFGAPRTATQS